MNKYSLILGDCTEKMEEIPDASIDMVLADPPFGTTQNVWDKLIPLEMLWGGVERVTKKNAAILLFSQMPFSADLVQSNRKIFRYEWIWQKSKSSGFLNAKRTPLKIHENILVFYKTLPTYNPQYRYGKPYTKKAVSNGDGNNYGKFE